MYTATQARNARFVVDIDNNEQLEIPFEVFNRAYERKIRASERVRMHKRWKRMVRNIIYNIKMLVKMTWQKAVGIGMIISIIMMMCSGSVNAFDWIVAGLVIPVAIYFTFAKTFLFKK